MKLISKFAVIGSALLMASAPASAIVTSWDYSVTSLFTAATYDGSGGDMAILPSSSLTWGVPHSSSTNGLQSSLVVGNNPAVGVVSTYLGVSPPASAPYLGFSTSLTHNNNIINAGSSSLLSAVLENTVVLDPLLPDDDPAMLPMIIPFSIAFTETSNAFPCAADSTVPCNDIFVLTGGLLNQQFDYGGSTYFVNIFPTEGGVLSILQQVGDPDGPCTAAGVAAGCLGFTTEEEKNTTLAFGFTISTEPLQIPEPGILALLGLGLIGLFSLRRRQ